jgi:hypothetical protein
MSLYLFAALAILAGSAASCQSGRGRNIFFIGVDGLDWEKVDALRAQGLMPNLDGLIRRSAAAKIETNEWGGGSALYWTDIATGQFSSKHRIEGFVIKDPATGRLIPNTSNRRRTKAFWNIFSEKGVSVGIVGWYITWPVEKVKGFMVSSYLGVRGEGLQPIWKGSFYSGAPEMVYPPSLEAETRAASEEGEAETKAEFPRVFPSKVPKGQGSRIVQSGWALMTDLIYKDISLRLYRREHPRVFAVYLSGVDVVGHRFTTRKPRKQQRFVATMGDVQSKYYEATDRMIGPLLEAAGPGSTVILTADHGLMRGEHQKNGVFLIAGPGIRSGVRLAQPVNLVDICPTMLYLMGQPVAEDMDGRVAVAAIEPDYLKAHRIRTVPSYGVRKEWSDKPVETNLDGAIIKRLKTLGYIK